GDYPRNRCGVYEPRNLMAQQLTRRSRGKPTHTHRIHVDELSVLENADGIGAVIDHPLKALFRVAAVAGVILPGVNSADSAVSGVSDRVVVTDESLPMPHTQPLLSDLGSPLTRQPVSDLNIVP